MTKANKVKELEDALAALEKSTRALVNLEDPHSVLRAIAEQVRQVAELEECSIILLKNAQKAIVVASSEQPDITDTEISISDYPELSSVIETHKPLFISDVTASPLLKEVQEVLNKKHILSIAVLPISMGERILGALFLRLGRTGDPLGDLPLGYFQATANAAALALSNVNLKKDVVKFERKSSDAKREAREERRYRKRYENLFHLASDGLVIMDGRGRVVDINRKFELLTGYTLKQALKLGYKDILIEEDYKRSEDFFRDILKRPSPSRGYFRITTRDGAIKHVMAGIEFLSGDEKQALISLQDITEEKNLQNQLQRSKEFFENIINSSVDAILAADMRGKIIVFNEGAENISDYTADEVIGKINIVDLYTPGGAKDVMRKLRSQEYGGVGKLETTHYTMVGKNGKEIPINVSAAIIYENGKEIATVGIFQDLRPRIEIEKQLRLAHNSLIESEKQAALAALSGATAHELNQPLTSIMGYTELLQIKLSQSDESVTRAINTIAQEADRMSEIIKKIGKVSRYRTRDYVGRTRIIDIDEASSPVSRYENLFLSMRDGLFEFKYEDADTLGECVFANPSAAEMLGKSDVGELLDRKAGELFDDPDIENKIMSEIAKETGATPFNTKVILPDRTEIILEVNANITEAEGENRAVELLCRNVTERTRVQRELEEAERRSSTLLEMAGEVGMGLVILSINDHDPGRIIFANERFEKILGIKASETHTFPLLNLVKAEDRAKFLDIYKRAIDDDVGVYNVESEVVRRDGSAVPVEFHATATQYMGRRVIIGFLMDISEWVSTRKELLKLKELSESVVNNAPMGIITLDGDGTILNINDRDQEIMGLDSKNHIVGANLLEISTIKGTEIEDFIRRGLSGERISMHRMPYVSISGNSMILKVEGVPLSDATGKVWGGIILLDDVTEEAELEESLRRERVYHDSLIEKAPVPIIGLTLDATLVLFNNAAEELSGYKREEVLGENVFEMFASDQIRSYDLREIAERLDTEEGISDLTTVIPKKDGEIIEILWNAVPVRDEKGTITGIVGVGRDLTEEKRLSQETLRRRQVLSVMHRIARSSIEGAGSDDLIKLFLKELDSIFEYDALAVTTLKEDIFEYKMTTSDKIRLAREGVFNTDGTFTEKLIRSREPRLVRDFKKTPDLPPDDECIFSAGIRSCMNTPLLYRDRVIGTLNMGNIEPDFYTEDDFDTFRQVADEFAMALENIQLVEQLLETNENLNRKTSYLETLLNAGRSFRIDAGDGEVAQQYANNIQQLFPSPHITVYLADYNKKTMTPVYTRQLPEERSSRILMVDKTIGSWMETKKDYIYYKNLNRVKKYNPFLPDAQAALIVPIRIGFETLGLFFAESHHTSPFDQDAIDMIVLMTRHMATSLNNVRLFEQACFLERSQEDIIENASTLIIAADRHGTINIFNKAFEKFTGFSKEEIIGKHSGELAKSLKNKNVVKSISNQLKNGKDLLNFIIDIPSKEGGLRKTVFNSSAVRDTRGKIAQYIFVGYDLTDREVLEQQLVQSSKLASLGQMAASIAHELNNPLTAISSYAQIMQREVRETAGRTKYYKQLGKILEGAERIEKLIGNLMDYSRMDYEETRELSINDVIEESLTFSEYELTKGNVKIIRKLDPKIPMVYGVGSQLQQVFINILSNASHVLQEQGGGIITIKSKTGSNNSVKVEIVDNGPGIPSEKVEKIFEPFYTTKPRKEGTGLGLSIVQDIVKKHDGHILVKTKPGKGTTFTINLPEYSPEKNDKNG